MKYPQNQYNVLVNDLPKVLNFFKIEPKDIDTANDISLLHTLHCKLYQQKNYTDDNANVKFVNGERLLPIDESFKLYPDGCNDNHIETAMKAVIKELTNNNN